MRDTIIQSVFRGRVGAMVLAMASVALTTYGVTEGQQNILMEGATIVTGLGAAALAGISKVRVGKK